MAHVWNEKYEKKSGFKNRSEAVLITWWCVLDFCVYFLKFFCEIYLFEIACSECAVDCGCESVSAGEKWLKLSVVVMAEVVTEQLMVKQRSRLVQSIYEM